MKNKSLLYISFSNYSSDGRTKELIKHLSKKIKIYLICYSSTKLKNKKNIQITVTHKKSFILKLFWFLHQTLKNLRKYDTVFIDNRKSALVSFLLFPLLKNKLIIQDMREFYTLHEHKNITSRIGTLVEGLMLKRSNIIITANKQRARLTKKLYKLKSTPLVYENRRSFNKNKNSNKSFINNLKDQLRNKIINIKESKINLVSSSGFTIERGCMRVVKGVEKNKDIASLYFVGKTSNKNKSFLKNYILKNNINNVFLIDSLPLTKLYSFLLKMQVGIVNYSDFNRNNIYCASGKIYEFLSIGMPVLCTENFPLKEIISNKYGISNNDFNQSISEICNNYSYFKKSAILFNSKILIDNYNKVFVDNLIFKIEKYNHEKK